MLHYPGLAIRKVTAESTLTKSYFEAVCLASTRLDMPAVLNDESAKRS